MQKINSILTDVLKKIKPTEQEISEITFSLNGFIKKIDARLKKLKINAEIFVGGSFAKKTMIKKDKYDADIFLRFDKSYDNEVISNLTEKILTGIFSYKKVHGSRDYFMIKIKNNFFIELIPVKKVNKPDQAENITDLSYLHVKYIVSKVKSQKMINEIMLSKAFCHANNCYGAESYINGFSGYSLELLTYYYGGFLKFLKGITRVGIEKEIIDPEKHYKKHRVLLDLNSSKLQSPIILIDPTYKHRNALAALSQETFTRFKEQAKSFLKNPSIKAFELQKTNIEEIKSDAKKKKLEFILLEASTQKQEGDIAGSKLSKFYKHLAEELSRYFDILNRGFNYNKKKSARYFFVAKPKKEILVSGPNINDTANALAFKKKHKDYFTKKDKIYSKEFVDFSIKDFFVRWINKNKQKTKAMFISSLKIID